MWFVCVQADVSFDCHGPRWRPISTLWTTAHLGAQLFDQVDQFALLLNARVHFDLEEVRVDWHLPAIA